MHRSDAVRRTAALPPTPPWLSGDAQQRTASGWPLALSAWSLLYMVPHLYWALGGEALLFMVRESAAALDDWRGINWAASVVLTGAALVGPALLWSASRPRFRLTVLAGCLVGAAVAGSHGAFGIIYRTLNVAGVTDIDGSPFDASEHEWAMWDLFVFEPWFLIEGVLFVGAGAAALATTRARRRWMTGCLAAIGIATLTGVLGLRV